VTGIISMDELRNARKPAVVLRLEGGKPYYVTTIAPPDAPAPITRRALRRGGNVKSEHAAPTSAGCPILFRPGKARAASRSACESAGKRGHAGAALDIFPIPAALGYLSCG